MIKSKQICPRWDITIFYSHRNNSILAYKDKKKKTDTKKTISAYFIFRSTNKTLRGHFLDNKYAQAQQVTILILVLAISYY